MKTKRTELQKLEWKLMGVILLALTTMTLMSGFMDRYGQAETEPAARGAQAEPSYDGIIRFHIRANSDTEQDQALKLTVRDQVMARIQQGLMDQFSREMAAAEQLGLEMTEADRLKVTRTWLEENLEQIEDWAEETVKSEGAEYSVKAALGVTWIPQREYDGIYFPPGEYEALTLDIGAGAGQNWWCVLFPPLCLIAGQAENYGDLSGEELDAWLASLGGNRIVLRSRILVLLK